MRGALIRYRFMAYLVGTLLIVLVCVGLPLKYLEGDDTVVLWTAIPHGWLYMVLLITAFDLGRRAKWSVWRLLLIALAGTVPFLSFVAERSATKNVRLQLTAAEPAPVPAGARASSTGGPDAGPVLSPVAGETGVAGPRPAGDPVD